MKFVRFFFGTMILSSIYNPAFASSPSFGSGQVYSTVKFGASVVSDLDYFEPEEGSLSVGESYEFEAVEVGALFSLALGYQFDNGIRVELGYLHLGIVSYEEERTLLDVQGALVGAGEILFVDSIEADHSPVGATFSVGYELDFSDSVSLSAEIGMFDWDIDVDGEFERVDNFTGQTSTLDFSNSADGRDIFFGLGLTYKYTNNMHYLAQWSKYTLDIDEVDGYEHDTNSFTVGIKYFFNVKQYRGRSATSGDQGADDLSWGQEDSENEGNKGRPAAGSSSKSLACEGKYKHLFDGCD
ncbi:MAG: hypothetical protein COA99_07295 [Moraxellaceae bacterium]|nr:MAG: hypothetical protein COA99_07295 [Moraxellaceae bacterium]